MKFFVLICVLLFVIPSHSQSKASLNDYDIENYNKISILTKFSISDSGLLINPSILNLECIYCSNDELSLANQDKIKKSVITALKRTPKLPKGKTETPYVLPLVLMLPIESKRKKEIIFLNELENKTSFQKFVKKIDANNNFVTKHENDTIVINKLNPRAYSKVISKLEINQTYSILSKIINKDIDANKTLLIHLILNEKAKLGTTIELRKYLKKIKKNKYPFSTLFIKNNNDKNLNFKNVSFYKDDYNFLKKTFFKDSPYAINHILIKPDGIIKLAFGQTHLDYLLDILKN